MLHMMISYQILQFGDEVDEAYRVIPYRFANVGLIFANTNPSVLEIRSIMYESSAITRAERGLAC